MVDLTSRLEEIAGMVKAKKYFTINRSRQYGKTTLLMALDEYLREKYTVVCMDFQGFSQADFQSEQDFVVAFAGELLETPVSFPDEVKAELASFSDDKLNNCKLRTLFKAINRWCRISEKPIVLLVDEVDSATNNQVFLDFLAQLRTHYLTRRKMPTFQSVILAGVTDVRSIRRKLRPDEDHKDNSPWNTREGNEENESVLSFDDCPRNQRGFTPFDIAADFLVDLNFSPDDIKGMLEQYEADYHTGMDTENIAGRIYDYTSGYPYLVSRICQLIDERIVGTKDFPDRSSAWTESGFYEAEKMLVREDNTLYQSLIRKLKEYPALKTLATELLFNGKAVTYTATADYIKDATMYGFVKNDHSMAVISNRIFEKVLYEHFFAEEQIESQMFDTGRLEALNDKPFTKRKGCRRSAYEEEEREFMKPLPTAPYEQAAWSTAKIQNDYTISNGLNRYSVPSDLISESVVYFAKADRFARPNRSLRDAGVL